MSKILINVASIQMASERIHAAKTSVNFARTGFSQVKSSIDGKIQNRSNIRARLNDVQNQLSDIETRIGKISATVQSGAEKYAQADNCVKAYRGEVGTAKAVVGLLQSSSNLAAMFKDTEEKHTVWEFTSAVTKAIGKYGESETTSAVSSLLGYVGSAINAFHIGTKPRTDVVSDFVSLLKSSADVETGLFDYFEKALHPYEAFKLDTKFGSAMTKLKIGSGILEVVDSGIDVYKTFKDPESSSYDKAAEVIQSFSPMVQLGGDVYVASQCSSKTLQFVNTCPATNQILATYELEYATTKAVATKAKNIGAGVTIVSAVVSGGSAAIKEWGEVRQDGKIDVEDAASIGMNFGVGGLCSMAKSVTCGIVDIDAEKAADHLQEDADRFVAGDSWAARYIRNTDRSIVGRFAVSVGSAAYIVGANVVEGVGNGMSAAASWVSNTWNGLFG